MSMTNTTSPVIINGFSRRPLRIRFCGSDETILWDGYRVVFPDDPDYEDFYQEAATNCVGPYCEPMPYATDEDIAEELADRAEKTALSA